MVEKIYQVTVGVKISESCFVKAKSKKEAIQIYKDGNLKDNPSIYSDKNIFNSDEIKTEMLGISDNGDYLWGSAEAIEIKGETNDTE